MSKHPSHVTRYSDSSLYDEVCANCGAHDEVPGGWGKLAEPCPNAPHDSPQLPNNTRRLSNDTRAAIAKATVKA